MVKVVGQLNDTKATGIIRFTIDHLFIDTTTTPDTLVILPYEAPIVNGQFSIDVPQSQNLSGDPTKKTEPVTYRIEILLKQTIVAFYLQGAVYTGAMHTFTDGSQWTGAIRDASSVKLDKVPSEILRPITDFHAVIPTTTQTVEIGELIGIPAATPHLDITVWRLAELLTNNAMYRDKISSKLNIKGLYDPKTAYVLGDLVGFNGNSYAWRNLSSKVGSTPPPTGDDANWTMIASKGDPGGVKAQIVGYNPTTWTGSNEAAARGDVVDAIKSLGQIDLSNYYTKEEAAPRSNPAFSGQVQREPLVFPVANAEQRKTEVITAQYVEDALKTLGASKLAPPIAFMQQTEDLDIGTGKVIPWNIFVVNTGKIFNGANFTIPETCGYLMYMNLNWYIQSARGSQLSRHRNIATLNRNNVPQSTFWDFDVDGSTGTHQSRNSLVMRLKLNAGDVYNINMGVTNYKAPAAPQDQDYAERKIKGSFDNAFILWKVNF